MLSLLIVLTLSGLIILSIIVIYNKLIRLKNTVKSSWSDVDVQLKKRYDLLPNLIETVKGYAAHEKSVFQKVTEARSQAMKTAGPTEKALAETQLQATLKTLFALAEAYPDLKANANFAQLQSQLQSLEGDIENARRYYNAVVRDYNILIESFPSNLIASGFKFEKSDFFELQSPETERQPVKVSFS